MESKPEDQNTESTQDTTATESSATDIQPEQNEAMTASTQTGEPSAAPETNEKPKKRNMLMGALGIIILLAIGAGVYLYMNGSMPFGAFGGKVVAVVNDREISRERLTESVDRTLALAVSQGVNTDDPAIREQVEAQALTSVVNTVLLIQAAENAGLTVSKEEVDAQVTQLEAQYGGREALMSAMAEVGIDDAMLRDDIREQLIVDQFIRQSEEFTGVTIEEAELIEAYQRVSANNQDVPPFADVKETIRQQLLAQKQQQAAGAIVERLRAEANIEIKI